MKRKSFNRAKFNTKLMLDVIFASLIVQKAPGFLDSVISIPESLKAVAGAGAGFLVGSMLKRSDLANASIALGAVDFISPMIDNVLGVTTSNPVQVLPPQGGTTAISPAQPPVDLRDYLNYQLNDYIGNPGARQSYSDYINSY